MEYFLLVALCAVTAPGAIIRQEERINWQNGWYVPQIDGSFTWITKVEAEKYMERKLIIEGLLSRNNVTFYLYTRDNPEEEQIVNATTESIDASNFNLTNPTRISIHGWYSSKDEYINYGVRDAWLEREECNFIFVDWDRARSIDYITATFAVPGVGGQVAALIEFLVKKYALDLNNLQVIGHSLGAHVAGFTGKNVVSGVIPTIVGLDPAKPLYNYSTPHTRLSSNDANYVETIQTNGDKLGFLEPIGKGSFYPNGGKTQPGCTFDIAGSCAHSRSIEYYVQAVIRNNFATYKCENYEAAVDKNCGDTFSPTRMGAINNTDVISGEYYVPVNEVSPYGQL